MTKLGSIDFDDRILDAIRDDRLVIFAGAGVSMGSPSNLASFWQLAKNIAGNGLDPTGPLDRFLGQLHHDNVRVHERAAKLLTLTNSKPNTLHYNLIKLFRTPESVRLVTTNFDRHFETAASTVFNDSLDVYRAPALPLGNDFNGIVYIHGALPHSKSLVLTDADFGRAYLTEGWCRRFLVDVFRQYTVLFVGYSHNDVVMQYLARALPAESIELRFALTEDDGSWDFLGIKPIRFNKGTGSDAFNELYEGVERLAQRAKRGALDWQNRMAEIGTRVPPVDSETCCELDQALREVHTTSFFTNVARSAEWPMWLNSRNHLNALFQITDLNDRDKLLAIWLAKHFAIGPSAIVIDLIAEHGLKLNPFFWTCIIQELYSNKETEIDISLLNRWVSTLLSCNQNQDNSKHLIWLAERCAKLNAVSLTLKLFLTVCKHRLSIKRVFKNYKNENIKGNQGIEANCRISADLRLLNQVWIQCIKPNLGEVAQPLLLAITGELKDMHNELVMWERASIKWDPICYGRSAIESHDQNQIPKVVDILIDSVRDALEWLVRNAPLLLDAWIEILVTSDVPLLRRLAIHAITIHPTKSPEDRLKWLIDRVGIHNLMEHHEIYRAVYQNYITAGDDARRAFVNAVISLKLPAVNDTSADERTARTHFDWLSWLVRAKPDCALAEAELAPIRLNYPDWRPTNQPDLTHWTQKANWIGFKSPWSIEQLLDRTPLSQLDDLLNFQGQPFNGPERIGLISTISETCSLHTVWGFELVGALVERELWNTDLWHAVFQGLQKAQLSITDWDALLNISSRSELLVSHPHDIANLLNSLVREVDKSVDLELLEKANLIALSLWKSLQITSPNEEVKDWLSKAINSPEGIIVEFWLSGLSMFLNCKNDQVRTLPNNYKQWLSMVVQDETSKGGLGRSILASQAAFLFELDEQWTQQYLIPLFNQVEKNKINQVWDGFLVRGRAYLPLVDILIPGFIGALQRYRLEQPDHRSRFIEFYTSAIVFHVADPTKELLPKLFIHGSLKDRADFAFRLRYYLQEMTYESIKYMWETWLHTYWSNRIDGLYATFDVSEISHMLGWLPHLGELFPEAVQLAISTKKIKIEDTNLFFALESSDLLYRYPNEIAMLLIYLSKCELGYHLYGLKKVRSLLPKLPVALQRDLDEAIAYFG